MQTNGEINHLNNFPDRSYTNELNFKKIFSIIKNTKPKYKTPWKSSYWAKGRSKLEKKISKLYNQKSSSFYAYENTKFNSCIPTSILEQFNLNRKNIFIQIIKLTPGNFIPPHYDRYNNYKTKHNITKKQKVIRIWIALSNPKFGHALFLDDNVIYDIPRGGYFILPGHKLHSGVNAGVEDRYFMTIDGIINGN